MMNAQNNNNDTIAAVATAYGTGGIAVIRISGNKTSDIIDKVFKSKSKPSHSKACFGCIVDKHGEKIDEGICTFFKAPHYYTGEDTAEISCHGGITVTRVVLEAVLFAGARHALGGEFTKRAFVNGKLDLCEAEAVIDLINADSRAFSKVSLSQLEGRLSKNIVDISDSLVRVNAGFLAAVDYPDDEIEESKLSDFKNTVNEAIEKCRRLIASFETGEIIKEGIKCAIIGAANSGKSSLLNFLAGSEKSIVTDIPGTTRDIVEAGITIDGIKLILSDTAGLRETPDLVEQIGVSRSRQAADTSELILCVIDGSLPLSSAVLDALELCKDKKSIIVINKNDLPLKINIDELKKHSENLVFISALTGEGVGELIEKIKKLYNFGQIFSQNSQLITNLRHKNCLENAVKYLENALDAIESSLFADIICEELSDAISALNEITGQTVNEKIVENIFERFCVGK